MSRRALQRRKARRKLNRPFELQLTSMLDVLVIILVFMLKSYQTSQNNLAVLPGLKLPISYSTSEPRDSLQVIITSEGITFEGKRLVDFQTPVASEDQSYQFSTKDLDDGGRRIVPLFDALVQVKQQTEMLRAKYPLKDSAGNTIGFDGIMAITADRRVPYDTLRKVLFTAGAAEFRVLRFIAQRRDY